MWNALSGAELPELEGLPAWKVTRELDPFKCARPWGHCRHHAVHDTEHGGVSG